MDPIKPINIEEVMRHIREAMSAHINRNLEKIHPKETTYDKETDNKIEEIPVQELIQPIKTDSKKKVKNIGRFSNIARNKESKMVENGGTIR